MLAVVVRDFAGLERRVPEVAKLLPSCTADVNRRYAEAGEDARVVLVLE
jgi:hypothetical protein